VGPGRGSGQRRPSNGGCAECRRAGPADLPGAPNCRGRGRRERSPHPAGDGSSARSLLVGSEVRRSPVDEDPGCAQRRGLTRDAGRGTSDEWGKAPEPPIAVRRWEGRGRSVRCLQWSTAESGRWTIATPAVGPRPPAPRSRKWNAPAHADRGKSAIAGLIFHPLQAGAADCGKSQRARQVFHALHAPGRRCVARRGPRDPRRAGRDKSPRRPVICRISGSPGMIVGEVTRTRVRVGV
jgi:hypothetical protein